MFSDRSASDAWELLDDTAGETAFIRNVQSREADGLKGWKFLLEQIERSTLCAYDNGGILSEQLANDGYTSRCVAQSPIQWGDQYLSCA